MFNLGIIDIFVVEIDWVRRAILVVDSDGSSAARLPVFPYSGSSQHYNQGREDGPAARFYDWREEDVGTASV